MFTTVTIDDKMSLITARRKGRIKITMMAWSEAVREERLLLLAALYRIFFPIEAGWKPWGDYIELTGYSEYFRPIEEGTLIPYYHLEIKINKEQTQEGTLNGTISFSFQFTEVNGL